VCGGCWYSYVCGGVGAIGIVVVDWFGTCNKNGGEMMRMDSLWVEH